MCQNVYEHIQYIPLCGEKYVKWNENRLTKSILNIICKLGAVFMLIIQNLVR